MSLIEWEDKFSVGSSTMDSHHQKLFQLLNGIHDANKQGHGEEVIVEAIKELASYTHYHFEEEEKLMAQVGYPGLAAHRQEHIEFMDKVQEYLDMVEQGDQLFVVINVASTVKDWVKQHIMTMDKQYESYVAGH